MLATLTFNFVITAFAFLAIIVLFLAVQFGASAVPLDFSAVTNEPLPYGWLGIVAALHFGLWYYLGIEGTCQAAEEVRSPARSLPYGTMAGIMTLLIAATLTWYVCSGLIPWEYLGSAGTPLFDAARVTGSSSLMVLLFIGTVFATTASANGCINDASRAWFSMGRDRYLPSWFGAVHPRYRTPYRSIVFLVPIALIFALGAPLDQVITFSILSGLLGYTFMTFNMVMFRKKWPLGTIKRGYVHPVPSAAGDRAAGALRGDLLRRVPRLRHAAHRDDVLLHHRLAVVPFLALPLRAGAATSSPCPGRGRRAIEARTSNPMPSALGQIDLPLSLGGMGFLLFCLLGVAAIAALARKELRNDLRQRGTLLDAAAGLLDDPSVTVGSRRLSAAQRDV